MKFEKGITLVFDSNRNLNLQP